jgi:hypothetical protein
MLTVVLPIKAVTEVIPITISFSDMLQFGETVNGGAVSASVFSGTDPTPQAILSGLPTISASGLTQEITGGVAGNIYTLAFLVTATNSHNYVKVGNLSVIDPGVAY